MLSPIVKVIAFCNKAFTAFALKRHYIIRYIILNSKYDNMGLNRSFCKSQFTFILYTHQARGKRGMSHA